MLKRVKKETKKTLDELVNEMYQEKDTNKNIRLYGNRNLYMRFKSSK